MFDVKKFLIEDLGFDEAEATTLAPKIKPEKATHLENSYGIHQQNLVAAAELEKATQQLTEANDRLNAEMAEWATLSTKEKSEATELRASLEAARVRTTQLESRITTLAQQAGVDPKTVLEGTAVIPERKPEPTTSVIDTTGLVRSEQFSNFAQYAIDLPAALAYIQDEHRELTGRRIDTREIVKIVKANAGKKGAEVDPVKIWETQYNIPKLRADAAEAAQAKLIADAEARGEERARSAAALPNATPAGRHSPVFGHRDDKGQFVPRTSALNRPQPGSTVAAAAAALRSGKYRVAPTNGRPAA